MEKILITGALGQLGVELLPTLVRVYGEANIVCSDIRVPEGDWPGEFVYLDVMDKKMLQQTIDEHQINQIYHLAATLSAIAENNPVRAWELNVGGLLNILEASVENNIHKVFWPSSIGVFGPDVQKAFTPQHVALNPATAYGISKVAGEKWCNYFYHKHHLDVRSIRFPGLIGHRSMPGGGTTDYAVEIFYAAVKGQSYTCFLDADTALPMMYMSDAVRAAIHLMEASSNKLTIRTSYNVHGLSFTPAELAAEIRKHKPDFIIEYKPDFRQQIAMSWPDSIDDAEARRDWAWSSSCDLEHLVKQMLQHVADKEKIRV